MAAPLSRDTFIVFFRPSPFAEGNEAPESRYLPELHNIRVSAAPEVLARALPASAACSASVSTEERRRYLTDLPPPPSEASAGAGRRLKTLVRLQGPNIPLKTPEQRAPAAQRLATTPCA